MTATGQQSIFPSDPSSERGADFSHCRTYRYCLWRRWSSSAPLTWVMLNPSTADESVNDPTVERCERRARSMGFGGVVVVNLFAYRATDPKAMKAATDPVGPWNDRAIVDAAQRAGMVICAWGNHGSHRGRAQGVGELLRAHGVALHALKVTGSGQPGHPLYLPNRLEPQPWEGLP